MTNFLNFYQHIPQTIDPIALRIGSFSLGWYSLMYVVSFGVVYLLLAWRVKKGEGIHTQAMISDFLLYAIVGLLLGARLGYVLFYNFQYFFQNPLAIISPFGANGSYIGISGMSYYGGVIGIILAGIIFCKKYKIAFWSLADFIIPAIPLGYFFGRLGNFLNGELFGRATEKWWGMYFADGLPGQGFLRHPSQLYEAFFEGLVLFAILWVWRNHSKFPGYLLLVYLFGYGFLRFFIEFFREPDPQIGLILGCLPGQGLTLGQIFSLGFIIFSATIIFFRCKGYPQCS